MQRRGVYERIGNNQMFAADPAGEQVRRFLVGPNGCEVTGRPRSATVVIRKADGGVIGT